jgi:hypothetical protein
VARIRSHGLYHNVEQEVARARTIARHGQDVEDLRRRREPERAVRVPDGLDPSAVPEDVLKVYRLATSPPIVPGGGPVRPTEAQQQLGAVRPRGFRSPAWDFSEATLGLLEEFGYEWDSSLMGREFEPYHPAR